MPFPPVRTVEYHTAGEPFRIVAAPPVEIRGATVAERRMFALRDPAVDGLRRLLCFEPRGHADMYGGFITPPDDDGAHFGVLFWHKDGFSTACGHGTIALGVWAVRSGLVAADPSGVTDVIIDVPSGRVTARVRDAQVDFVNVASYVLARDVPVATSAGDAVASLCFGGAIYACVSATSLGLAVTPSHLSALIALGREIKWALNESAHHPSDPRLSGVYGTIFFDDLGRDGDALHQRNVTIFADGEVDRSPCGSGTCARLADLVDSGALRPGQELRHDSIIGTQFRARVLSSVIAEGRPAVIPQISGMAYPIGESTFTIDPDDPLVPGFVLR
ncbi:MAG TPA: proline racemase family protein [Jatrophihabitantaceae bacterium]|nr:proline racemase family protein [Jatrophihabitantaceae bacterium]